MHLFWLLREWWDSARLEGREGQLAGAFECEIEGHLPGMVGRELERGDLERAGDRPEGGDDQLPGADGAAEEEAFEQFSFCFLHMLVSGVEKRERMNSSIEFLGSCSGNRKPPMM